MEYVSNLTALVSLCFALITDWIVKRCNIVSLEPKKYPQIEGLRGYVAFFVFLHHSCIWYYYLRTHIWQEPPSALYTHFGQSSVTFFFMITGLLFFSKLLNARTRPVDWQKLYIGRFLRIIPLYLFAMTIVLFIIYCVSNGQLYVIPLKLLSSIIGWLSFTFLGAADINGFPLTQQITAGVVWTLPYEWEFYFSLPLIGTLTAIFTDAKNQKKWVAISAFMVILCTILMPPNTSSRGLYLMLAFANGAMAAIAIKSRLIVKAANGFVASLAIPIFLVILVNCPSVYAVLPFTLLSLCFILITCGNTVFGILVVPAARILGEIAYSVYLLHGICLFILIYMIIGIDEVAQFSLLHYWMTILAITPVVIIVSSLTFRYIELPAMQSVTTLDNWLKKKQ